ncbi:hypothetical protein [Streptomyces sp. NPDC050485]|uniref:hypothetical protein n=1 Tax=Streptomyces sp. NPDC050485 TaxID=3365617 RepID=UPI0037A8A9B2
MPTLFTDPVQVWRAEVIESAYTKKRDWTNKKLVFEGLANTQPDRAFEVRSPERETAQERILIYLPHGTDVDSADRVFFGGHWFEVDGNPMEWTHRSLRHVRIRAWRVEH